MSLLHETSGTVLQANFVQVAGAAQNIQFKGMLGDTKVLTGIVEPRETQVSILFTDENGQPIQIPSGAVPFRAIFVPVVPIESANLADTFFNFSLFDNTDLNNSYTPWSSYSDCDGNRMNARMMLDLVNVQGTAASFAPYPYVGVSMSGLSPVTAGAVKLYLYYYV